MADTPTAKDEASQTTSPAAPIASAPASEPAANAPTFAWNPPPPAFSLDAIMNPPPVGTGTVLRPAPRPPLAAAENSPAPAADPVDNFKAVDSTMSPDERGKGEVKPAGAPTTDPVDNFKAVDSTMSPDERGKGPDTAESTVAPTERTLGPGEENPYETEASNEQPVKGSDLVDKQTPAALAPDQDPNSPYNSANNPDQGIEETTPPAPPAPAAPAQEDNINTPDGGELPTPPAPAAQTPAEPTPLEPNSPNIPDGGELPAPAAPSVAATTTIDPAYDPANNPDQGLDETAREGNRFIANGDNSKGQGDNFRAEGDIPPEELGSPTEKLAQTGPNSAEGTEPSNPLPNRQPGAHAPLAAAENQPVPAEPNSLRTRGMGGINSNGATVPAPAEPAPAAPERATFNGIPLRKTAVPATPTPTEPPPAELPEPPAPVTEPPAPDAPAGPATPATLAEPAPAAPTPAEPAPAAPAPKTPAATPGLDSIAKNRDVIGRSGKQSPEATEIQQNLIKSGVAAEVPDDKYDSLKKGTDGVVRDENGKVAIKHGDMGYYGKQTEAAVNDFQGKSGILNPDGQVGRATAVALKEVANSDKPLVDEKGEINKDTQTNVKGAVTKDLMVDGLTKLEAKSVTKEAAAEMKAPSASPDAAAAAPKGAER